jgi:hypothetical protein
MKEGRLILMFLCLLTGARSFSKEKITSIKDVLTVGQKLTAPTPDMYYDDLIHPCVRYIPEGFAGHKWWMVASPYLNGINYIEDPLLYYGNSDNETPPTTWTFVKVISTIPERGINVSCNMEVDSVNHVFYTYFKVPSAAEMTERPYVFVNNTIKSLDVSKGDSPDTIAAKLGRLSFPNTTSFVSSNSVKFATKYTSKLYRSSFIQSTVGYNSDPDLFYDGSRLWVFWRENFTLSTIHDGYSRVTYGVYTYDGINFSEKKLFAGEKSATMDFHMCPIVVKVKDEIKLYGCHHEFSPNRIPLGLAIWSLNNNDLDHEQFTLTDTVIPKYPSGFDFWHFDLFQSDSVFYCVVTPEVANKVLLGKSTDGIDFKFWETPLLTSLYSSHNYLYKPSAMVLDGLFYLWIPSAEPGSQVRMCRIWMYKMDFKSMLMMLDEDESQKVIESVNENKDIKLYLSQNGLTVDNNGKPEMLIIYDLRGILVYKSMVYNGRADITLPKGFYLLNIGNIHKKIAL